MPCFLVGCVCVCVWTRRTARKQGGGRKWTVSCVCKPTQRTPRPQIANMMNAEAAVEQQTAAGPAVTSQPPPAPDYRLPSSSQPVLPRDTIKWTFANATSGLVGKQFQLQDKVGVNHKIVVRHNTVTGELDILLDGVELLSVVTDVSVGNWSDEYFKGFPTFDLLGQKGTVEWCVRKDGWGPVPSRFGYGVVFNNDSIVYDSSKRATSDKGADLKVWITTSEITGAGVVWYRVDTKVESTGLEVAVHRRFSDFHFLNSSLSMYFKGSHLYNALPSPPPKGFKLWEDQKSPDFIENRRMLLEKYLRNLIMIPRVAELQELYDLLGIVNSDIRETSMIFSAGPLGLTLRAQASGGPSPAVVADFKPGSDGVYGPAKQSGLIGIGDCISKVDGESVFEDTYDVIVQKIQLAPRPVLIHFLGYGVVHSSNDDTTETTAAETVPTTVEA